MPFPLKINGAADLIRIRTTFFLNGAADLITKKTFSFPADFIKSKDKLIVMG
jgi:hypothetical protein